MKKLLITTDSFLDLKDGVARYLHEVIPRIKDKFKITVLAPEHNNKYHPERYKGVNVKFLKSFKFKIAGYKPAKPFNKLIKKEVENCDILWNQIMGPLGISAIYRASKIKKPIIHTAHVIEWELIKNAITRKSMHILVGPHIKSIIRRIYNKCNLIISPSKSVVETLKKNKIIRKKIVIPLGIDTDLFKPTESNLELKKKIGLENYTVIGYCGRISKEKSISTLYKAFLRLKKKKEYNTFLLIVGWGKKKNISKLKQLGDVKITGFVDDVLPYLQAMDIFVLPSLTETSSLATMEAMSCGLPVIATKVGYVKEYIKDKENGLFFPKKNDLVLSLKLEQLINNKKLRQTLGKNARKTALERFSWDITANNIIKTLNSF